MGDDEANFYQYSFYYVTRAGVAQAEQNARDWTALFSKASPRDGFLLVETQIGEDIPRYVSIRSAKDPADFYSMVAKANAAFGDAGLALNERTFEVVRKFEQVNYVNRPDLSLTPDQ